MSGNIKNQIRKEKLVKSSRNIAKTFLEGLYFAMESLGESHASRFSIYQSMRRKCAFSDWNDTRFSRQITGAVRSGYLTINPSNSVEFTNKAKLKIVDTIISNNQKDNKIRFISFDIPEVKRSERDGFRRVIKNMGFRQIQKSLWACDRNVGELVEIAKSEFGVEKYVVYIVSEKSDIDDHIRKILNNK